MRECLLQEMDELKRECKIELDMLKNKCKRDEEKHIQEKVECKVERKQEKREHKQEQGECEKEQRECEQQKSECEWGEKILLKYEVYIESHKA
jgi:hypothetical protein